jgi:hypothetical protein
MHVDGAIIEDVVGDARHSLSRSDNQLVARAAETGGRDWAEAAAGSATRAIIAAPQACERAQPVAPRQSVHDRVGFSLVDALILCFTGKVKPLERLSSGGTGCESSAATP